jgi:hypothetical protein
MKNSLPFSKMIDSDCKLTQMICDMMNKRQTSKTVGLTPIVDEEKQQLRFINENYMKPKHLYVDLYFGFEDRTFSILPIPDIYKAFINNYKSSTCKKNVLPFPKHNSGGSYYSEDDPDFDSNLYEKVNLESIVEMYKSELWEIVSSMVSTGQKTMQLDTYEYNYIGQWITPSLKIINKYYMKNSHIEMKYGFMHKTIIIKKKATTGQMFNFIKKPHDM